MQRSASDVETTTEALFPDKEERNRWGYGHTALVFSGAGIIVLTVVFTKAYHSPITVGPIAWLALSVSLILGGLIGALNAFDRRKVDRFRGAFAAEICALETKTAALENATKETSDETRLSLATLAGATRVMTNRQEEMMALLAHRSLEQGPPKQQHAPRQRRRRQRQEAAGEAGATGNVVNLPNAKKVYQLGIAEGLRRRRDAKDDKTDR